MKARTIINGVVEAMTARNIEKYAQMAGFQSCKAEETQHSGAIEGDILFIDSKGAELFQGVIEEAFGKRCPIFIVPVSENEKMSIGEEKENITGRTTYPFRFKEFYAIVKRCISEDILETRDLCFGRLYIDRENHAAIYKNIPVSMQYTEYSILIFLLEHVGEAVSREKINGVLPKRKRDSARNVDTHIKNIRHKLEMKDVIVSVRSVGYRIDEEKFYRWICL